MLLPMLFTKTLSSAVGLARKKNLTPHIYQKKKQPSCTEKRCTIYCMYNDIKASITIRLSYCVVLLSAVGWYCFRL